VTVAASLAFRRHRDTPRRVQSSRLLERAAQRNVEVMWLASNAWWLSRDHKDADIEASKAVLNGNGPTEPDD